MADVFEFHEFFIPEHLSVFVGGVGAAFGRISEEQLMLLHRYIGLAPDRVILKSDEVPAKHLFRSPKCYPARGDISA